MPIYMDRHDLIGNVTAAQVAELHQYDLKVQDQFGCRGLTYWFDDQRNTAFCLIEAPDISAITAMHDHAHGQVPNRIIEVSQDVVESFLGRIQDPQKPASQAINIIDEPAFRIILLVALKPPETVQPVPIGARDRLEQFNQTVIDIVLSSGGKLVRQKDYYFLAAFTSVVSAVESAFGIYAQFGNSNPWPGSSASLKVGVSTGEPVTESPAIFEDTVRLAERMCRIVKGAIILSSEAKELYLNEMPSAMLHQREAFCLTPEEQLFLTGLMDFTEESWNNADFKVEDFDKPLGCSKSQFYRKMISLTGKSPSSFLKEYRLNEALALLKKRTRNVSEVALETGFNSHSYFSKCFQQQYGCLPSELLA